MCPFYFWSHQISELVEKQFARKLKKHVDSCNASLTVSVNSLNQLSTVLSAMLLLYAYNLRCSHGLYSSQIFSLKGFLSEYYTLC